MKRDWIYYGTPPTEYGFFATKVVNGAIEIWIATSTQTKLFATITDPHPLDFEVLTAMPSGTDSFELHLKADRTISSTESIAKLISGTGATLASYESSSAEFFSREVRGFWHTNTTPLSGPDAIRFLNKDFTLGTEIEDTTTNYFAPLPSLVFVSGSRRFGFYGSTGIFLSIPDKDYQNSIGFILGSDNTLVPRVWTNPTVDRFFAGSAAERTYAASLTVSKRAEPTNEWWYDHPYLYYLTALPSTSDDSVQNRIFEKFEIKPNVNQVLVAERLGTVTLPIRGFNDLALTYKCYAIPIEVLNALPLTSSPA